MANFFPIIIEGVRFLVNPTSFRLNTQALTSEVNTMSGPVLQIWYPRFSTLYITGYAGGTKAYRELTYLRDFFFAENRVANVFYKTKLYKGTFTLLDLSTETSEHIRFKYQLNMILLDSKYFKYQDFALGIFTKPTNIFGISTLKKKLDLRANQLESFLLEGKKKNE